MLITVVAVMCQVAAASPTPPPPETCEEVIVTDSDRTEGLTLSGCAMTGEAALVEWKLMHPIYRGDDWRIAKHRCIIGRVRVEKKA